MKLGNLEITEEMINKIIYNMENQNERWYINLHDGALLNEPSELEHIVALPEWDSQNGFKLMSDFTKGLPDVPLRNSLLSVLNSGRGVFKRFRMELKGHVYISSLWEKFKYCAMKKAFVSWLDLSLESFQMEAVVMESPDLDYLIGMDFSVRAARLEDLEEIRRWHGVALQELRLQRGGYLIDELIGFGINGDKLHGWSEGELDLGSADGSRMSEESRLHFGNNFVVVESMMDGIAGFICLELSEGLDGRRNGRIGQFYVRKEFRSLGLSKRLFNYVAEMIEDFGGVSFGLWVGGEAVDRLEPGLKAQGFSPSVTFWQKDFDGKAEVWS